MQGNDLGNLVVPRDVVVWEGLVGLVVDDRVRKAEEKFRGKERWADAVACYEVNEMLARKVWDLVWRFNFELDLLTYHGHGFAKALAERMDNEDMPFRKVWSEQPHMLARRLSVTPQIRTIYDPNPEHQFVYGSKGRILMPDQYNVLGAM